MSRKGKNNPVRMLCETKCGWGYTATTNTKTKDGKFQQKKYCRKCRKRTNFKESKLK